MFDIRSQFPNLGVNIHGKPLVYFDNAATTLKPLCVIERLDQYYRYENANIHRGVHFLSEQGTQSFEATRDLCQNLINAKFRYEIIFTRGATDAINLLAHSLGRYLLKKDDVILISTLEHHSNIVPWQLISEMLGAKILEIPITDDAEIDLEAYAKLLNENPVKIVSTNHISNAVGTINPIKKMIKMAHDKGAVFVVDGAQSVPHMRVDVQDLDCDFLAFSAHKMFGPTGVGVLYGKENLLDKMPPYQGGGDMIDKVTIEKTTYNVLPHKFEAGTPIIAGVIAFAEAIKFINTIGLEQISKIEADLLSFADKKLREIPNLKILGPNASKRSGVASFVIKGVHPHDLGTLLDQQGIAIRTGHHCTQPLMARMQVNATARASFSIYNTNEEIEFFISALKKSLELL
jgi:cysteine desulfurase/selenocysteine lyase